MYKIIGLCLLFFLSSTCVAAQPLIIGTLEYNPPYSVYHNSSNTFDGFEVDLMRLVCKSIGRECKFKGLPRTELEKQVINGDIDIGIGTLPITSTNMDAFHFSLPYIACKFVIVTLASNNLKKLQQLKPVQLGTEIYVPIDQDVKTIIGSWPSITQFQSPIVMIHALKNKKLDGIVMDVHGQNTG